MPGYLMTMDDSADEDQTAMQSHKHNKGLCTVDNTIVNLITCPHELIYTPA